MELAKCLSELSLLKVEKLLSMNKIEFYLLKFSDLFKETSEVVKIKNTFELPDNTTVRLPSFWDPTDEEKFLELYNSLETISKFHRNEKHFEKILAKYHSIKKNHYS